MAVCSISFHHTLPPLVRRLEEANFWLTLGNSRRTAGPQFGLNDLQSFSGHLIEHLSGHLAGILPVRRGKVRALTLKCSVGGRV